MKNHYYFDNAATTFPKPELVYRFMDNFFREHGVNPGRSGYELAIEAEGMIAETRRMLGNFFGYKGDSSRVTFSMNATDSINTALLGLIQSGDHIVTTRMEHNAVLRPVNHLERDCNVSVTKVAADGKGYIDPEEIRQSIKPETSVVIINHASNVIGSLQDIESIGSVVRDTEAVLIVDTCQTAGVIPIRMDDWNIDILVYTGHKGLFGPSGIGGMIIAEGIDIRPLKTGGTGVNSLSAFHPDQYPHRLEAGTISIPGIAGLHAAQKWFYSLGKARLEDSPTSHYQACETAVNLIHSREMSHTQNLLDAYDVIPEVKIYGPSGSQPRVSTFSINIGDLPAEQVSSMLDSDHGICVRSGLHCAPIVHDDQNTLKQNGTVRFAPGFFTDEEDISQAIAGVQSIVEYYTSRKAS
jgi:cysteine desulfurase family protein